MKKILIVLLISLSLFSISANITSAYNNLWANWYKLCSEYNFEDNNANVWDALDKCLWNAELVKWEDVSIDWWFWDQIKRWTQNISLYLWVFAVASIVIGALMLTISAWEEEKIKKAKDVVKWGIIWFLGIVVASTIITLIIKIVYSL